jgi:hypothetical protein
MTIMRTKVSLLGILSLALVGSAPAGVILSDNFDGYANQAAFEAVWTPIGTVAPLSATLTTDQSVSPANSIRVDGTATSNQQRNRRSFTETGTPSTLTQITFSFDFYDSNGSASPYRQFSNLQDTTAPTATCQLIAMGLNNNQTSANSGGNYYMARILGYVVPTTPDPDGGPAESVGGSGAFFKLNDFGVGLSSTGWHNLKVVISTDDGLSTDFAFYVDGVLAELVSNVGSASTLRSYDNIALGSGLSNAGNAAYFDNMFLSVEVVPEPATWAVGAVGLGLLLLSRRARG